MGDLAMTTEEQAITKTDEVDTQEDKKLIDDAVAFINEKVNETIYQGSIKIGEYILENFFEGDLKLASSKNPRKKTSFNNLCENEELTIHPNRLGLMVRVACQERYFSENEIDTRGLSYTHKASLVKVEEDEKKINLAKDCINEKWTTRQLEDAIKKYLNTLPPTSNPSLIRTTKKFINKIDHVLKTVKDTDLKFDTDDISKMSAKRRDTLKTHLTNLETKAKEGMDRSKTISENCSKAIKELAKIEAEKKNNPVKQEKLAKKK